MRKKVYAIYPHVFGVLRGADMAELARQHGLVVVDWFKAEICCHASLAVFGTKAQRDGFVAMLAAKGHKLVRCPSWLVGTDVPREQWLDVRLADERAALRVHFGYSLLESGSTSLCLWRAGR